MKGSILAYDTRAGTGVISGDDGNRYRFAGRHFKADMADCRAGMAVDFRTAEDQAGEIYPVVGATGGSGEKSKIAAGLLGIFLGGLGIHKFYLGAKGAGITMLMLWLFGWILLGLPSMVVSMIGFIEGILYIMKSDADFERTYVRGTRSWF